MWNCCVLGFNQAVCVCVWGCAVGVNNLLIVWLGMAIHYKLHVNVTRPNCQTGSANRIANQGRSQRVRAQVEGLVLQKRCRDNTPD